MVFSSFKFTSIPYTLLFLCAFKREIRDAIGLRIL